MQSDGEPSIVALKTATLLASPFVELVLCEIPVGEHATDGVAESAMREVKRQTRTLKFALEAPRSGYRRWQQIRSVSSRLSEMA